MGDYYAGPLTALVCCDAKRRVLVAGHAVTPITGWPEADMIGRDVVEALRLAFPGATDDPLDRALEWGVRVRTEPCTFRPYRLDEDRPGIVDLFPAYDDDGGLLIALTPVTRP